MLKKGLFITFEGPDGSGKTTISKNVYQRLLSEGYDVIYTREPGGIEIAEQIRRVILDPSNTAMDRKTEALLYAASRRQHLVEKILPALNVNKIVICDRFVDSSLVYQGIARDIGVEAVWSINKFAIDDHLPDMSIYLDISAEEGLSRICDRINKDRLDQEELCFHQMVVTGYHQIIDMFKDRYHIIDASQNIDKITVDAYRLIVEFINKDV
ncbi:MAG: dTMP kinase [Erysipelotrichaceae bacterium]|nr:dTMP kinase [Erysipelotrichaceae bacterium]MDD3923930.1 dTMP kinase [Erysipelotrichaceae bacterium]MDD4642693.1 dTMP kinase [Erysipelotrichaceae bacterium]